MKAIKFLMILLFSGSVLAENPELKTANPIKKDDDFKYQTEQFADLAILRYTIPGFEELTPKQKELLYYLSEAAYAGRDIFYDQNFKHNLKIRRTLEGIVTSYSGNKTTAEYEDFMVYTKRVWFSNGIHHHYSTRKILPEFSKEYFSQLVQDSDTEELPLEGGESVNDLITKLTPIIFDPEIARQKVNQDPEADLIKTSANNFYEGVNQKEVEDFYASLEDKNDPAPVWHGLNSKLVKEDGQLKEKVWKVGGMYSAAIEKIVFWLEKAVTAAENDLQKRTFEKLIEYYQTGDLRKFDEYNILWVQDTISTIDAVNGFIEVYGDPLGHKGSYESVVSFKDMEATKRIDAISREAQWFEDNSPILPEHKKKNVVGISAKVITVTAETGDSSPSTPIGINLPNANWIRKDHGSKSVNLGNIVHAYDKAGSEEVLKEFAWSQDEIDISKNYSSLADNLHTDMHEVIGHASGQINEGIGTPKQSLKSFASTIEEARADLVALYFLPDGKLLEIGVVPHKDVYKAEYQKYIRNGLMLQLQRIKPGETVEESHMRNRQLIAKWVYEKGLKDNVIEKKTRDGKTYFVINDYVKLKELFGELLRETQRITSEGDYNAARELVESYGVQVDADLHKEVLARYERLHIAPYKGFINPVLKPVYENDRIIDVIVEYPDNFTEQMLDYAKRYSFLPNYN